VGGVSDDFAAVAVEGHVLDGWLGTRITPRPWPCSLASSIWLSVAASTSSPANRARQNRSRSSKSEIIPAAVSSGHTGVSHSIGPGPVS
jgi:hypothetical protein